MEKKHWKKRTLIIEAIVTMLLSFAFASGVATAVYADLVINTSSPFIHSYTDNGNTITLTCYPVSGANAGTNGVAIAWGTNDPTGTPDSFTVPSTFTEDNTLYTVKAIAESGFRYCDFQTISLPDTIIQICSEAFYCCTQMTSFTIPAPVTKIAPSTFMDCRSMTRIDYSDGNGGSTKTNNLITTIGDHAFTSCVSLRSFDCPLSLKDTGDENEIPAIGDAAFQNCRKLMSFFFPSKIVESNTITNPITVGDYAFSDCVNMSLCYFQENLVGCGQYAFAECTKLSLYYTGSSTPSGGGFHEFWRKRIVTSTQTAVNDTNYVPINQNQGLLKQASNHPGLYFTVTENSFIYLDGRRDANPTNAQKLTNSASTFASVFKFDTPDDDQYPGYWETIEGKKTLTIPETVTDATGTYDLKVLGVNAFLGNTDIESIVFSSNLVQICHQAFYGCTSLKQLNFEYCLNLREVSYRVFQDDASDSVANTAVSALGLPKCLKYIGAYAFYNFKNVTSLTFNVQETGDSELCFIGRYAFANLGANKTGKIDLELPKSLNDSSASTMKPYRNGVNEQDRAVMAYAFKGAKGLKTVTMEQVGSYSGTSEDTSISINVFEDCTSLIRFTGNRRLYRMGMALFKNCSSLKEMFLNTDASANNSASKPWGVKEANNDFGGKLFDGTSYANLIIYVDAASAPKQNANPAATLWNSESTSTFKNEFPSNTIPLSRPAVPVYYGVDWTQTGTIRYMQIGSTNILTSTDYSVNVVAFITKNNKHTITRCYCKEDVADIDLSGYSVSNDIDVIGIGAFAQINGGKIPGKNIVLPSNLTVIEERAFYRQNNTNDNSNGVQKITYKTGNPATEVVIGDRTNYCALPSCVTRIERLAFYNNKFTAVSLPSSLSFLGNSAFSVYPKTSSGAPGDANQSSRATIDLLSIGAGNSNFSVVNNGVYYTGDASRKTLLYQAAVGTNTTLDGGAFAIDSGTKAVGVHAVANTNYTKIKIPDSVEQLYGGAFQRNGSLQEVVFGNTPTLQYIAGKPWNGDSEIYDGTYFDILDSTTEINVDKNEYATTFGVFHQCTSLTTIDLTQLTDLKKIGYGAFEKCSNLEYLIGSDKYTYYKYNDSFVQSTLAEERSNGILDLSACTNLRSIGRYSFGDCPKLEYMHLPNTSIGEDGFHILHVATDPDSPGSVSYGPGSLSVFNGAKNGGNILLGETAHTADSKLGDAAYRGNAGTRYPSNCFTKGKVYYHVSQRSDVIMKNSTSPETGIRYWTEVTPPSGSDKAFILFDSGKGALNYFPAS